jgi:hypothetical protein
LFALNLSRRLVAVAKALSGMVNINLHLRLLLQPSYSSSSSSTFSRVCRQPAAQAGGCGQLFFFFPWLHFNLESDI